MLRAVGASDADIRPVVAGVAVEMVFMVENPLPIRRPTRAEIEMVGMADDAHTVRAIGVARPDFVATRAGQMKRHPPSIRAEAQPVGQPLASARELASVRAVEVHAENLPDLVA